MAFDPKAIADLAVPITKPQEEIAVLSEDIKVKATTIDPLTSMPSDFNPKSDYFFGRNIAAPVKESLEQRNYNIEDAYVKLNDGTYLAKYDSYKEGRDNAEYFGQTQTATDKWLNGTTKFLGKTGLAIIGGTVGMVNSVGKLAEDGTMTSLYDNDFTRTLDDWNTKLDYKLPNYYTKQEQDRNIFGQATTANFWADKVLGGLSFTAGAIVSEGIWAWATGGSSLGSTFARWGSKGLGFTKVAQGVNNYKSLLKSPLLQAYRAGNVSKNTAIALGRAGDFLNAVRFTITSAGYEASVEALQYKKEATENFYNSFAGLNGRQPTDEDIEIFQTNLNDSANAVFGMNMAIVGSSNLVTLGGIFNLKNPIKTGIGDFIEKKAFGRGITSSLDDAGKTIYAPIQATRAQKITRNIFDYGKTPVVEGLYEEGLQGVTTKTANKWIEHSYNPQLATENVEMAGLIYESLGEQYGTKEGWVENGIGMIIGALGGTVNVANQRRVSKSEIEFKVAGLNTFTEKVLGERLMLANRVSGFSQEAAQEAQKGNIVKSRMANDGVLHAKLNHQYQLGGNLNETVEEARVALDSMTTQQFIDAGVATATETAEIQKQIEDFKIDTLNQYSSIAKQFTQNRKYAEYVIGKNRLSGAQDVLQTGEESLRTNNQEALIQSLTWNLTAGENAGALIKDIQDQISNELGIEQSNVLRTLTQLNKQQTSKKGQLTKNINKRKALVIERDRLQKSLIEVQNTPQETEGNREQGRQLGQLNIRLLELDEQINTIDLDLQVTANELNSQKQFGQDISNLNINQIQDYSLITVEDLSNLDSNIENFEKLVQSYEASNPKRYRYLQDLLDEYSQAQDIFKTNQATALAISSGNLKLKNINSWLSKQLSKKDSLDEFTKDWLIDILRNYQQNKVSTLAKETGQEETISSEEYQAFTEEGIVSDEILNSIASKSRQQQQLTEREQEIFNSRETEIQDIIKETLIPFNESEQIRELNALGIRQSKNIKKDIENLAKDNYILTHITDEQDAKNIFNSVFEFSLGGGLSGTATLLGSNGVLEQLNRILSGNSPHRGLTGMTIFAIPKNLLRERATTEDIENFIIENYPESIGDNIGIPNEFNAGYFNNSTLYLRGVETVTEINPLTPLEQLKQRLDNLLKRDFNSLTYIGENYDEIFLKKPSKSEIEEYRRLKYEDVENERMQFLREKLGNWRLLDSAVTEENQSIADLIDLIEQLETTIDQIDTQDEITPELIQDIASPSKDGVTNTTVRYDLAQNTLGSTTVQILKDKGIYKFSHLKMSSILNNLGIPFNSERLKVTKDGKVIKNVTENTFQNYTPGTTFHIDNTRIVVGTGNTLEIKAEDYLTLRDSLNLHIIVPTINWSYFDVYEKFGEYERKRPSDFEEDINPQLLYDIKPEDNLGFQIANDSYNQSLRDRVLNEEMSPALEKEIQNSLKIYITYKGQPISTLKATGSSVAPSDNFLLLRETAKKAFITNPTSPILNGTVKARKIFLGSPQLTTENLTPINSPIPLEAINKVISTGYVQNGEFTLSREVGEIEKTYLTGAKDKKQPVIIFKRGAYNVAYPVSLIKSSSPVAETILSIVQNNELTETAKIKAINQRIIETGIASDKRLTEYNIDQINAIINDFSANQTFVSMDTFSSPNYRWQNLTTDILINIDLNNLDQVISDAKLEIDLNSININTPEQDRFENIIEVDNRLSDLAIELYTDYTQNAQIKYINSKGEILEDTNYTNVFDEGIIITNPTSHVQVLRNANAIKQAFSEKLPKIVKSVLSPQIIEEVEFLIRKQEFYRNQTQPNREETDEAINENSCG